MTKKQEKIAKVGGWVALVVSLLWWLNSQQKLVVKEIRERDQAQKEFIEDVLNENRVLTSQDFEILVDSLRSGFRRSRDHNASLHAYSLSRQDSIRNDLEFLKLSDSALAKKINRVQLQLDAIANLSQEAKKERKIFAKEDSLRSIAIRAKQELYNRERMRQSEMQHRILLDEYRKRDPLEIDKKGTKRPVWQRRTNWFFGD